MKKLYFLAVVILILAQFHVRLNAENSGAAFLKIGVGARAAALGSAFTALSGDVSSMYWNPGGMASLSHREFSAMHSEWLLGSGFNFAGAVVPTKAGAFGVSAVFLSQPSMERRDENRQLTGEFGASDAAFGVAYAKNIPVNFLPSLSGGANLKFIRQQIDDNEARGVALDLGLVAGVSRSLPLTVGLAVQNLGPRMAFINESYALPLTFSAGMGWRFLSALVFGADVRYQAVEKKTSVSFGTEYAAMNVLNVRAGYTSGISSTAGSSRAGIDTAGLAAGIGFKIMNSKLDYAFVPYGDLGSTQIVSLSLQF